MGRKFLFILLFIHLVCEANEGDGKGEESSGSPLTLDIKDTPTGSDYKKLETQFADANAVLFVPSLENIASIVDGKKTIWTPDPNQFCKLCIVFLNETVPMMVYIMTENTSGDSSVFQDLYLKYKNDAWMSSKRGYPTKITRLMLNSPIRSAFALDINAKSHGHRCHNHKVFFDYVPTDLFIPRPGYICNTVKVGDDVLWSSEKEKCVLVMAHLREQKPYLVHMFIWDEVCAFKHLYAELNNEGWAPIKKQDYESAITYLEDLREMPKETRTGAHFANLSFIAGLAIVTWSLTIM